MRIGEEREVEREEKREENGVTKCVLGQGPDGRENIHFQRSRWERSAANNPLPFD